jgi:hypothetical protein
MALGMHPANFQETPILGAKADIEIHDVVSAKPNDNFKGL